MSMLLHALLAVPLFAQTPCAQMARFPDVTAAEQIATHCRVSITLRPSPDSEIKSEVWLPAAAAWNGKFLMEGGGGFVGSVNAGGMAKAVREGYASASTDTGHSGGSGRFALGHPEKITDFAHRAVHVTAVKAKALIAAYYRRGPRLSYWEGCSTGGRQGLMSAQRYPEDFDGIIAGAPANNQIVLCAWRMRLLMTALRSPEHGLPPEKLKLLNDAVLDRCDARDGVKDRQLEDPRDCDFHPAALRCTGTATANCLTAPQLETVQAAYTDIRRSTGELLYPRLPFGGELGWRVPGGATEPGGMDIDMFRYLANQDASWDWRRFDLEKDVDRALRHGLDIHAVDPNLTKFKARGGKLLLYHGWSDGGSGGAISAFNTISYVESVMKKMGGDQREWMRLFLVPGMAHCGGGTGPNQFHSLAALERWRERGEAPRSMTAVRVGERGVVEMSRPLCPYPERAVYRGSGSVNDAGNFQCLARATPR
ncbi:MAG: tannase/feruloyl esterase family alpha/beta hydrolase [Bryobacterales bacterium]|nr:tannase/feruloyl esterase family alpha/beta hydrolase [Bryobacterales bacterium]